uniref:Uncharacterized protein n=1 Tax=Rhizophora mucronata TaxID=61149 RepID=A0A2P2PI22_RHIMU
MQSLIENKLSEETKLYLLPHLIPQSPRQKVYSATRSFTFIQILPISSCQSCIQRFPNYNAYISPSCKWHPLLDG